MGVICVIFDTSVLDIARQIVAILFGPWVETHPTVVAWRVSARARV